MSTTETRTVPTSFEPTAAARNGGRYNLFRAVQLMVAKPSILRRKPPVLLDLATYRSPDFVYDTSSLTAVWKQLEHVRPNKENMRWLYQDAVLFYAEKDLDVPYDDFVAKVDIARAGMRFRDVLGITTEVLRTDEQGRTTLQLERIAALVQPNYTSFLGKDELDVYKLEFIEYGPDEQRNSMRTVNSANSSAICDDGYLAFVRVNGKVRITFLACQHFPSPRLMALLRMDRIKWLKNMLTRSAYKIFTNTTWDNLIATYEGREFRVGRATDRPRG
jgi:hypothetical protein